MSKKPIVVLSAAGKGGVGKSTVASALSILLSENWRTFLIDADIEGPDIAEAFGWEKPSGLVPTSNPFEVNPKLALFSPAMMLPMVQTPIGAKWQESQKVQLLDGMFKIAEEWGAQVIVIDMPPGIPTVLKHAIANFDPMGVVITTIPSKMAMLDTQKAIAFYQHMNCPIIGIVSNMDGFEVTCPGCKNQWVERPIGDFPVAEFCLGRGIPLLATVPMKSQIEANVYEAARALRPAMKHLVFKKKLLGGLKRV